MKLIVCVLLLFGLYAAESEIWKTDDVVTRNFMENESNKKLDELENCNGQVNCPFGKIVFEDIDTKRNNERFTLSNLNKDVQDFLKNQNKDNAEFTFFPTNNQNAHHLCSCGRENRLVDLGIDYYPRYVSDMICIPGGCGKHSCKPKHFKLWVLRKRRNGDVGPGLEPVPFDLRGHWISENIITTIDCECI